MALYIVVHHRLEPLQTWANAWVNDQKLKAITTTNEIAQLCEEARRTNNRVYVHRCAWGGIDHVICCSACVLRVGELDHKTSFVEFIDITPTNSTPSINPIQGQNYYNF
jgi:hypothetical protein